MQQKAFDLLKQSKYSESKWYTLDLEGKEGVLNNLVADMNTVLNINISSDIVYFDDNSGTIGEFRGGSNNISVNLETT